jgi:hypothetical protein
MKTIADAERAYGHAPAPSDLRLCSGGCLALIGGASICLVCETRRIGRERYSDPPYEWQLVAVLESFLRIQNQREEWTHPNPLLDAVPAVSSTRSPNSWLLNLELAGA